MLREERRHRIATLLGAFRQVSTDRIAGDLGVSRETVRRDIVEMEELGLLKRVHGGAVALDAADEPPLDIRAQARRKEKRAIAGAAARLVTAGQTLFIDAGSTVSVLAEQLSTLSGLTVITNSFDVALKVDQAGSGERRRNEIILLGGRLGEAVPATFGDKTVAEIFRHRADFAFLSPVGLHARYGAMSFDPREAEVARAMVDNAARTVILADSSKIGVASRVSFCSANRIDTLVSDWGADALPEMATFRRLCAQVTITA